MLLAVVGMALYGYLSSLPVLAKPTSPTQRKDPGGPLSQPLLPTSGLSAGGAGEGAGGR